MSANERATLIDRFRPSGFGKPVAHFMHIGKTGGTAVKEALRGHRTRGTYRVVVEPHRTTLADVPPEEHFFFFVRDPISRYLSGFVSRQRRGAPRYDNPWRPAEEKAFTRFETANDLAEALGSEDPEERAAAEEAMRGIGHVRTSYWDWFRDEETVRSRADRLLFCGTQETLGADFPVLMERLGLQSRGVSLPTDEVKSHRTPSSARTPLSDRATAQLRQWYAREYDFLVLCAEVAETFDATPYLGGDAETPRDA